MDFFAEDMGFIFRDGLKDVHLSRISSAPLLSANRELTVANVILELFLITQSHSWLFPSR